jgi:hypothetical protein
MTVGILAVTVGACSSRAIEAQPAGQLVREVVYNELNDHEGHGYWRYWVERRTPKETRLEDQIETAEGPIARLSESNGRPLSPAVRQQEQARLDRLLSSPAEQARRRQAYEEDEKRIGRILALLPDAFLYQYDGEENGCYRLHFRPNPDYPAHSIEARIFHAMSGALWVNRRYKRLARLDGHTEENVDFGLGILGRLYKGGWFQLSRTQVGVSDWKTDRLEVHLKVRALLVKSFARETSEERGGFTPVPAGMNLAQGMALLAQTDADNRPQSSRQANPSSGLGATLEAPAAFALRR